MHSDVSSLRIAGNAVVLAPMAGVTDVVFREICLEFGADLTFTEMVSAKGLSYANDKTRHLIDLAPNEERVGVQLFGHEPKIMADQAAWVEQKLGSSLACIDINMGCPARKIVTKGDGSALMKSPDLASNIVYEVKRAVACPVTVKMRRGWSEASGETCVELARLLEDAGACAITVHGRFAQQMYRGVSERSAIARVKQAVGIPVIGNGDIRSVQDALDMKRETGCDSVMVARGVQGNPWLIGQIAAAFKGEGIPENPTDSEKISMARRHAKMLYEHDAHAIVRMRKHAMWYVFGMSGASAARGALNKCSTLEDFDNVLDMLLEEEPEDAPRPV